MDDSHLHHYHFHDYGCHKELTFYIRFPDSMTFKEVHSITQEIEHEIQQLHAIDVTMYSEPVTEKK